ncbi:MAG: hypothetical protein KDK26_07985 [Roseivivax sp.]|nr:hypothetical protein [Roseivivax sp.]
MFFQMDDSGDSGNGIKSFSEACGDLGIAPVPAFTAQSEAGFCYEFHSGMHGDAVVYVNKSKKGDRINKNVPAIKLGPPVEWQRGEGEFKSKEARDALATVEANAAVFRQMYDAWTAALMGDETGNGNGVNTPPPQGGTPPLVLPISVQAPQPNPFNLQATKEYVFNETGNIMIAKTVDGTAKIEDATRDVFNEVSVFFAAMTRAMATTINPKTGKRYSIFDIEAMEGIIEGSGMFIEMTKEQVTHQASSWGLTFSKELIEALLGFATGGGGELAFASALVSSIGNRGLTIGSSSSKSDGRVGSILFVCEYLFGMPMVSALVIYIDSKAEYQSFTLGPCVKENSSSVTLNMSKDTYLFVTPTFIKKYAGDLLSVESDLDYLEFVDYLQDLVERKPIIQAVQTTAGDTVNTTLSDSENYAILGAFLDNNGDNSKVVVKFVNPPSGQSGKIVNAEVQSNVVNFAVTGTLNQATVIGLYTDAAATTPYVTTPGGYTIP